MNAIGMIHFIAQLIIAGAFLRFVELKWPDTWIGHALGVVY